MSLRSISGNAGVAAATVSWTGPGTGSTTADGSGNYSTGLLLNSGTYTIVPSLTGFFFTPVSRNITVIALPVTGINFTATSVVPSAGTVYPGVFSGATFASAFANPSGLDILQVVNEGGQVVWNLSALGVVNLNPIAPTPTAMLDTFFGATFAAAFPQSNVLDILQIQSQGGHVIFGVNSQGSYYTN